MNEKIKKSLRINNSFYDDEIKDIVEAAKLDLKLSGVASSLIKEDDPLIIQAIKSYAKAFFGLDNSESEKWKNAYSLLKQHLAIAYREDNKELQKLIKQKEEQNESV